MTGNFIAIFILLALTSFWMCAWLREVDRRDKGVPVVRWVRWRSPRQ